jgi:hypothetical protein
MARPGRAFRVVDSTTIALHLRDGWGVQMVARLLGWHGPGRGQPERWRGNLRGRAGRRPSAVPKRKTTGRKARMLRDGAVFTEATRLLGLGGSPEQIPGRRKREDAGMQPDPGLRLSHVVIYPRSMPCRAAHDGAR